MVIASLLRVLGDKKANQDGYCSALIIVSFGKSQEFVLSRVYLGSEVSHPEN